MQYYKLFRSDLAGMGLFSSQKHLGQSMNRPMLDGERVTGCMRRYWLEKG